MKNSMKATAPPVVSAMKQAMEAKAMNAKAMDAVTRWVESQFVDGTRLRHDARRYAFGVHQKQVWGTHRFPYLDVLDESKAKWLMHMTWLLGEFATRVWRIRDGEVRRSENAWLMNRVAFVVLSDLFWHFNFPTQHLGSREIGNERCCGDRCFGHEEGTASQRHERQADEGHEEINCEFVIWRRTI